MTTVTTAIDDGDSLIERHFSGESVAEALAQALAADPGLRARLMARVRFETTVHRAVIGTPVPLAARRRHRAIPWLAAAGIALLLAGAAMAALVGREATAGTVIDGDVLVDGRVDGRITTGSLLTVAGTGPATISLAGGGRAVLDPATQVVVRPHDREAGPLLDLVHGQGRFSPADSGRLRVRTPVGRVTVHGQHCRISAQRGAEGRSMAVAVGDGSADVHYADRVEVLSAGMIRAFPDPRRTGDRQEAVVIAVAADDRRIALRPGHDGLVETLAVAVDAEVLLDGRPTALAELPIRCRVMYTLDAQGSIVVLTATTPPPRHGRRAR